MEDRLRAIIEACFPPSQIDSVHIFPVVVETLAIAYVRGNSLPPCNHSPLTALGGEVVESSATRLTIRGELDGSVIEVRFVCTSEVGRHSIRRRATAQRDPRALSYSAPA